MLRRRERRCPPSPAPPRPTTIHCVCSHLATQAKTVTPRARSNVLQPSTMRMPRFGLSDHQSSTQIKEPAALASSPPLKTLPNKSLSKSQSASCSGFSTQSWCESVLVHSSGLLPLYNTTWLCTALAQWVLSSWEHLGPRRQCW